MLLYPVCPGSGGGRSKGGDEGGLKPWAGGNNESLGGGSGISLGGG